jgi:tetratricopeptide (TPR) repeat protein
VAVALALGGASSAAAQEADVAGLSAAAKAAPRDPAASLALGRALRRAGRFGEAARELSRGAGLGAAAKAGLTASLRYELARVYVDQHDAKKALAACAGVAARSKALGAACRAEAHLSQNRATLALPEAESALALEPGLYEATVAEGRGLALEGKLAEAEKTLRAAIGANDRRPEAHLSLANVLATAGRKADALAELQKARGADAGDAEIAFQLGQALGTTAAGRDALAAAVRIRPTYAPAQAALAEATLTLGDAAAAEAPALAAVKLDPGLYAAHVALGRVRVAQERWDDALREAELARKLVPNAAAAELVAADALAGTGDIDLAVEGFQKAFNLDHGDPAPLVRASLACARASRFMTAKGFADKATPEFPKWAPGWLMLGDLAARDNDRARARSAYERALAAEGPVDKDAIRTKLAQLR